MSQSKYYYNVKNRSASTVVYRIPEENIRRRFMPSETKRISYEELYQLSNQPGGKEMMANFLQIQSEGVPKSFGINIEPEYYMSEAQIIDLLKKGSQEAFLDCLDYAPEGVIDLIKQFSVSLPLDNYEKRVALKEKTGFDVDAAIANGKDLETKTEKVKEEAVEAPPTGRRTSANYKVITPINATTK